MPRFFPKRDPFQSCGKTARLSISIARLVLWTGLVLMPASAVPAAPALTFQEEVQEIVKEAASQSTVVPDTVKKSGESKPVLSVQETCHKIGAKLNSVKYDECMASGLQLTGHHSVEGVPIMVREFAPIAQPGSTAQKTAAEAKPAQARVLLIGGVHGDEYSSVSIVFKWMKSMEKNHTGLFHWHIIPLVNPDGLLRPKSTRTNANGVDLNRNFPTRDWKEDSADYWVRRTGKDPRRFPGKSPLSEPETTWLFEEIKTFRPNVIVSIHAPFGLLDFDGPPTTPPERLGHIYLSLLGTYPGSLGRYAVESLKIPIITIELPHAGIMPSPAETESIWSDLVGWMRGHVFEQGHVPEQSVPEGTLPQTIRPLPVVSPTAPVQAVKPKAGKPRRGKPRAARSGQATRLPTQPVAPARTGVPAP